MITPIPHGIMILITFVMLIVGCVPSVTSAGPSYRLEVRDANTNEAIPSAHVSLGIQPSLTRETDPAGIAVFENLSRDKETICKLVIRADGYKEYSAYYRLEDLPHVVYLEPLSPTPIAEGTLIASPTSVYVEPPPTESPVPTAAPTATMTPLPPTPTQTPTPPLTLPTRTPTCTPLPVAPLFIRDLWPTNVGCGPGHWFIELWVKPEGGNGIYKYYIDGTLMAGPLSEATTIHLTRVDCVDYVATMTVESGDQIRSEKFYVKAPDCCR